MNLLGLFITLNVINVILQTVRSIATVKCGKMAAALVNALSYGLYTIVIVYTNCSLALWAKVVVVAACNMVGVYVVKLIEEKLRKDKLWKIEATFYTKNLPDIDKTTVPHSYVKLNEKHTIFNFYCVSQKESSEIKQLITKYNGKYFASETKIL